MLLYVVIRILYHGSMTARPLRFTIMDDSSQPSCPCTSINPNMNPFDDNSIYIDFIGLPREKIEESSLIPFSWPAPNPNVGIFNDVIKLPLVRRHRHSRHSQEWWQPKPTVPPEHSVWTSSRCNIHSAQLSYSLCLKYIYLWMDGSMYPKNPWFHSWGYSTA